MSFLGPPYWIPLEFPSKSLRRLPVCAMTTSHTTSLKGWRPDICYFWAQLLNSPWIPLEFPLNLPMLIASLCYNYFTHYVKAWKGWRHDLSCFHAQWAAFACSLLTLIGCQSFPAMFAVLTSFRAIVATESPWIPFEVPSRIAGLCYDYFTHYVVKRLTSRYMLFLGPVTEFPLNSLWISLCWLPVCAIITSHTLRREKADDTIWVASMPNERRLPALFSHWLVVNPFPPWVRCSLAFEPSSIEYKWVPFLNSPWIAPEFPLNSLWIPFEFPLNSPWIPFEFPYVDWFVLLHALRREKADVTIWVASIWNERAWRSCLVTVFSLHSPALPLYSPTLP